MIHQFNTIKEIIDFIAKLEDLEKELEARGKAINTNIIPSNGEPKPQTLPTEVINKLSEFKTELESIKHSANSYTNNMVNELRTPLNKVNEIVNGIVSAGVMTQEDKNGILNTFNGLKNNINRQLNDIAARIEKVESHTHEYKSIDISTYDLSNVYEALLTVEPNIGDTIDGFISADGKREIITRIAQISRRTIKSTGSDDMHENYFIFGGLILEFNDKRIKEVKVLV